MGEHSDVSVQKATLSSTRIMVFGIIGGAVQIVGAAGIKYMGLGDMGHITQFALDSMFVLGLAAGATGILCAFISFMMPLLGGTLFMLAAVGSALSISGGNMASPVPMILFLLAGSHVLDHRSKNVRSGAESD